MMDNFERGQYSALQWISSVYHGKQYYFLQDNGTIYSRDSGKYLPSTESAIEEFVERLRKDGE